MKTILLLLISCSSLAQVHMGLGTGTTLNARIGFTSDDGYTLNASFDLPYSSADKARIFSLNGGKEFQAGRVFITPTIGGAALRWKDFSQYDKPPYRIIDTSAVKVMYGLEAGIGCRWRLSGSLRYCDRVYYGINLRYEF